MDGKIIVRESKSAILVLGGLLLFYDAFILLLTVWGICRGENISILIKMDAAVIGWTFPAFAGLAMDYCLRKLELGYHGCCYRTMFGRRREFLPGDVAEVRKKHSSMDNTIYLCLIGHDGSRLAKVEMNMLNSEKVIPFFESYNASAVWTEAGWVRPLPVRIDQTPERLVVRPNRKGIVLPGTLLVLITAVMAWLAAGLVKEGVPLWFLILAGGFLAVVLPGLLLVELIHQILLYKNMRLILTPGTCSFTNLHRKTVEFQLMDIDRLEITGGRGGNCLEIVLRNGKRTEKIVHDYTMDNVGEIRPFIEYYQKAERKICE